MIEIENVLEINMLLDFYSKLLTEKQEKAISMYYEDDFSLNEIAETLNITKQAVSDNIKRAVQNLEHYEKILGLVENYNKSISRKEKLLNLLENLKNSSSDLNLEMFNEIISLINDEEVQNGI
ncbi:YlxM family DNA-binding protein [Peptoniphilus indolicus]|uniref:UPF0122 protein HMPREF9129_1784 n=2 Tax=Peptoniphilus indolicus TaxID=33030 RepID=G4D5V4_9FIRM|nr:sigma factor-like helix-turn-helix DNA-binding protein [Peptoniphilus indolicus]EGY78143.1 DNA-binding protein [Peptoniphilus indolicus ATCC 29427]SUB76162.1 putative DNA-binding protein [Peptoniphilus indolicus]